MCPSFWTCLCQDFLCAPLCSKYHPQSGFQGPWVLLKITCWLCRLIPVHGAQWVDDQFRSKYGVSLGVSEDFHIGQVVKVRIHRVNPRAQCSDTHTGHFLYLCQSMKPSRRGCNERSSVTQQGHAHPMGQTSPGSDVMATKDEQGCFRL